MPSTRSTRQCHSNRCCCCNPVIICLSMLGLRRNPLCRSSLGWCIPITYLTIMAARKPSSSSNTMKPLHDNVEETSRLETMASDAPVPNSSHNHDNVKVDKSAVIAKEPKVSKPMAYEPLPVKKPNGLSNGTTNRTSHTMTQRKTIHFPKLLTISDDQGIFLQALNPIRVPPNAGANPVSYFQKTSKSQPFKRRSSKRGAIWSQSLMTLMMPTFIA